MSSLKLQRTHTRGLSDAEIHHLVHQNQSVLTIDYDPTYLQSMVDHVFKALGEHYFRPTMVGFEEGYPERRRSDRPLIWASNHSGMAFPWDAMVFGGAMYDLCQRSDVPFIRILTAPMLSETKLMNPYMTPNFWKRMGGIDATFLNFETLMSQAESDVLIYPEGVPGIGKGFNRRYQLQRFSTSFVRMALKYDTDIIPVYSINGEYINPHSYRSRWVNAIVQRLGIPFLPIGFLTAMIPFFPWIFYFGLPAKFYFVRGKRLRPRDWLNKPWEDVTADDIAAIRDRIHAEMQTEINAAVQQYGQQPYQWRELRQQFKRNRSKFWGIFPLTWCLLFTEHERQYRRYKRTGQPVSIQLDRWSALRWIRRNPFALFFFVPILGWIPLAIRGYSARQRR